MARRADELLLCGLRLKDLRKGKGRDATDWETIETQCFSLDLRSLSGRVESIILVRRVVKVNRIRKGSGARVRILIQVDRRRKYGGEGIHWRGG